MDERRRNKTVVVFLDSSVVFAAVLSAQGGSARIFADAAKNNWELVVSKTVVAEVEKNISEKLPEVYWPRFRQLLKLVKIDKRTTSKVRVARLEGLIVKKDAKILVDAKRNKTDYLTTLDKKHILVDKAKEWMKPTRILTPGEFLQTKRGRYLCGD